MSSNSDNNDYMRDLAHDMRSPLNAIGGFVDMIEQAGPVNPMQKQLIARTHDAIMRAHTLIDNVMDMSQLNRENALRAEACHMALFVNEGMSLIEGAAAEKDITVQATIPEELPLVMGDAYRLKQMVNNLLGNAVKYNRDGGEVHVTLEAQDESIVMRVADTGLGISEDDLPHIFEQFYRGSTGKRIRGNGLGLALVKAIIDRHQGQIDVSSIKGEGTTFTVILPQQPKMPA